MSDTAFTDQLPPRMATSTRGSRKWATLGGRGTSSTSITRIPTNDSETNKNNGLPHRQSTSLFRKASTISRTNEPAAEELNSSSLKKSRSLMNVLRSKLNSPAVLRRFRSKSRESTKQTVTEINAQPIDDQEVEEEIKQPEPEQTTRKSRKRDPSPMRRLANRITQFTRHHKTTSPERQKKTTPTDSKQESISPLHNKNEVEHINTCYDEIRAKYFDNNTSSKRNTSTDGIQDHPLNTNSMNGSLLSNDFLDNSSRTSPPLPTSDDPVLQARKQANIKLNCLLSGYSLTTSFANHEKSYGQNDLFKFNHYYDVGKRKYDYNFTNTNNRIFSSMKTRPMSKSIDSFRRTTSDENEVATKLERMNVMENATASVQAEKQEDVRRILPDDNELVIREDHDLIESPQNVLPNTTNIKVTTTLSDENKISSSTTEEHDDEFEQNFLRAVDRALGVVNKDENDSVRSNENLSPVETDEGHLNLAQMTEQALSSINNSTLFTNDDQKNEQIENTVELENTEIIDHTNASLKSKEQSTVQVDQSNAIADKSTAEDLLKVDVEKSASEELSNVSNEKPANEAFSNTNLEKSTKQGSSKNAIEKSVDEELPMVDIEKPTHEDSSKVDIEKQTSSEAKIEKPTSEGLPTIDTDSSKIDTEESSHVDLLDIEEHVGQVLPAAEIEEPTDKSSSKVDTAELSTVDLPTIDNGKQTSRDSLEVELKTSPSEELSTIDTDSSKIDTEESSHVDFPDVEEQVGQVLPAAEIEEPTDKSSSKVDTAESSNVDLLKADTEKQTDPDSSIVKVEKLNNEESADQSSPQAEIEKSVDEDLSTIDIEQSIGDESSKIEMDKATDKELSNVNRVETTNDILTAEDVSSVLADLTEKVDEFLFEDSKNGQAFLTILDAEEKIIKNKADAFNKILQTDDSRLTEEVRTDINAVIGEVNLLLKGKLKQFRGLCEANMTKSTSGEPIPLDSDLEGFWDITYPLMDKVNEKFTKLDTRKANQWALIEEYDPNDVNNRPRVIDDRLKQFPFQQNKSSKIPIPKSVNADLKKLIQERRKAAASTANQNHDVEIFVTPK